MKNPIITLATLFCTYDNGETNSWRMGEWKEVGEEVILFTIKKPNFVGVITIKETVNPANYESGM